MIDFIFISENVSLEMKEKSKKEPMGNVNLRMNV